MRPGPRAARCSLLPAFALLACFSEATSDGPDDDDPGSSSGAVAETSTTAGTDEADTSTGLEPSTTDGESESTESSTSTDTGATPVEFCADVAAELGEPITACTDFENDDDDIGAWALRETMGGLAQILIDEDAPSPTHVLATSFPATEGVAPEALVELVTRDVVLLSRLRFRMDLVPCDGEVTLAAMHFVDDDVTASLVRAADGELLLSIEGVDDVRVDHALHPEVVRAIGPWSQWELRVDIDAAYVDVLIDGVFAAQITDIATPGTPTGAPTMRLGIARKSTGFACATAFDDIVVY